ncbi:hypothetical protein BHM03_00006013 [Ensete ventricosum]|nr:hypothetical protein BHM03_00006013 [Ensete ventricosum]
MSFKSERLGPTRMYTHQSEKIVSVAGPRRKRWPSVGVCCVVASVGGRRFALVSWNSCRDRQLYPPTYPAARKEFRDPDACTLSLLLALLLRGPTKYPVGPRAGTQVNLCGLAHRTSCPSLSGNKAMKEGRP